MTPDILQRLRNCVAMKAWKRRVMRRDKHACRHCGAVWPPLHVDHIVPLSVLLERYRVVTFEQAVCLKELFKISNGQTLCVDCHRRKTRKDARRYRWRKDWIDRLEKEWGVEINRTASAPKQGGGKKKRNRKSKGHRKLLARCWEYSAERDGEIDARIREARRSGL